MKLCYITCSDLREDILPYDVIELFKIDPRVEIGIQADSTSLGFNSPKYKWLDEIVSLSYRCSRPFNIAIHVNFDWCDDFCNARLPDELSGLMDQKHPKTRTHIIKRWQLNIGDKANKFNAKELAALIRFYGKFGMEFILPYNKNTDVIENVQKLKETGAKFSILHDGSYGRGISPLNWEPPVFDNYPQGYSGGMGPDNVCSNLEKISMVVPEYNNYTIWIDAEGQLMKPGTREIDLEKCKSYIKSAVCWEKKNSTICLR